MPYFREEDKLRRDNSWSQEAHDVLVVAIQTIDQLSGHLNTMVDHGEAVEELRQRLDLILNSDHQNKKRGAADAELQYYKDCTEQYKKDAKRLLDQRNEA